MNELEQERMEAELRRLTPARLPENFMARLAAAKPQIKLQPPPKPIVVSGIEAWLQILRWLAPATAVAVAVVVVWRLGMAPPGGPSSSGEGVKIEHELVSSFEAVGRLPDGEPVRFRCQNWMDQVVLNDKHSGMMVQQRTPRMEVVPMRFETY